MNDVKKFVRRQLNTWRGIISIYVISFTTSAWLFSIFEKKPFGDSLWWACTTATTTGYGDMYPITLCGRLTGGLLMHFIPYVVAPLLIAKYIMNAVDDHNMFTDEEQKKIMADLAHTRDVVVANAFTEAEQTEIKEALKLTRDTIVANAFTEAEQTDFKDKLSTLTTALDAALEKLEVVVSQTDEVEVVLKHIAAENDAEQGESSPAV